jgi:hypothetical protein
MAVVGRGLLGGAVTMFRPDGAMFAGAAGVVLVVFGVAQALRFARRQQNTLGPGRKLWLTFTSGLALCLGFAIALTPWTVRNARVFGRFQPIAPENAANPGEFDYAGYTSWLRTWVDDQKYIEAVEWSLDYEPIHVEDLPEFAFDSADEKARVAALFIRYNNGTDQVRQDSEEDDDSPDEDATAAPSKPGGPDQAQLPKIGASESHPAQPPDVAPNQATNQIHNGPEYAVHMTPEIDREFGEIARERIARHPVRYYLLIRLKRAASLWFDTHSQYYPFEGEFFPIARLNHELHQQYWLPLFGALTLLFTLLAGIGAVMMVKDRSSWPWLALLLLLIVPRVAFLSTLENPEPRYVVELFTFLAATGSLPLAALRYDRIGQSLSRLLRLDKSTARGT